MVETAVSRSQATIAPQAMFASLAVLERARTLELEVQTQLEHIERLHRIMERASSFGRYAGETVEKLAELERRLNSTIDEMCDVKREALEIISVLKGEERAVLENYYILAKPWEKVAQDLYMSLRRVYMLRKKGLEQLDS